MRLRGLVSTVAPEAAFVAIHFLYAVTEFSGTLAADEREGHLCWWPVAEAAKLPMPHANTLFLPKVLDQTRPFYQAKYVYSADWEMIQQIEHISP
jgi:hypothetical protein